MPAVARHIIFEFAESLGDPSVILTDEELASIEAALTSFENEGLPAELLPELYNVHGLLAQRRNNLPEATKWFGRALKRDPRCWVYANNFACILLSKGLAADAIEMLEKAAKSKESESEMALGNLALALFYADRPEEAYQTFEKAVASIDPKMAISYIRLAANAAHMGLDVEAIELFARYISSKFRVSLGDADAVEFIRSTQPVWAPHVRLDGMLERALRRGIGIWPAISLDGSMSAGSPDENDAASDDADDTQAERVFRAWEPLRRRAMSVSEA